MKTTEIIYVTQYYNTILEWDRNNITIDTACDSQIKQLKELQAKAIEQSGLSINELSLIITCRKYRIFKKINTYTKRQIERL